MDRDSLPVYPEEARRNNIEGKVKAWVYVEPDGRVTKVEIKQSAHELLSQATIEALSKWKIRPPMRDGQPIKFIGEYDLVFTSWMHCP